MYRGQNKQYKIMLEYRVSIPYEQICIPATKRKTFSRGRATHSICFLETATRNIRMTTLKKVIANSHTNRNKQEFNLRTFAPKSKQKTHTIVLQHLIQSLQILQMENVPKQRAEQNDDKTQYAAMLEYTRGTDSRKDLRRTTKRNREWKRVYTELPTVPMNKGSFINITH